MADEPLRVGGVGLGEHGGPLLADGVGVPVVDVGGGVQADPGVAGGGCVIGTARGDIDAQWTVQLARLGMALAGRAA